MKVPGGHHHSGSYPLPRGPGSWPHVRVRPERPPGSSGKSRSSGLRIAEADREDGYGGFLPARSHVVAQCFDDVERRERDACERLCDQVPVRGRGLEECDGDPEVGPDVKAQAPRASDTLRQ